MKKNLGSADRIIRIAVAALIAVLYFTGNITGILAIILGIVAIIFILTALVGFCPLYWPLHINTLKKEATKTQA